MFFFLLFSSLRPFSIQPFIAVSKLYASLDGATVVVEIFAVIAQSFCIMFWFVVAFALLACLAGRLV